MNIKTLSAAARMASKQATRNSSRFSQVFPAQVTSFRQSHFDLLRKEAAQDDNEDYVRTTTTTTTHQIRNQNRFSKNTPHEGNRHWQAQTSSREEAIGGGHVEHMHVHSPVESDRVNLLNTMRGEDQNNQNTIHNLRNAYSSVFNNASLVAGASRCFSSKQDQQADSLADQDEEPVTPAKAPTPKRMPKISITFHEEDAKYDGAPLITPKVPYQYKTQYKKVDPNLTLVERAVTKFYYVRDDTVEYIKDILFMRQVPLAFKTAEFIKRNWLRLCNIAGRFEYQTYKLWVAAKHAMQHMGHGLKTLYKDGAWAAKTRTRQVSARYDSVSYEKRTRLRQVKRDVIKFVPFSLFLIIPGAEVALPAWIMVFPNSVPSQFVSDADRTRKFIEMKERQELGAEKILYIAPSYLSSLAKDDQVASQDVEQIQDLKTKLRGEKILPTDLLQYRSIFTKYCQFSMFNVKTLVHIAHFHSINPVTGLNTVNNLLGLFSKLLAPFGCPILNIQIHSPYVSWFTRTIIARELNMLYRRLRQEDLMLSFEDMEQFDEENIDKICFKRGIKLDQPLKDKMDDLKLWLSISNLRNVPHSLLLLSRVNDFEYDNFEIDENETQDEILRRSKSDAYYIESARVFDKAFGIDKLEQIIKNVHQQRQNQEYDPSAAKFIFSSVDLAQHADALDDFQTRHSTITDRINQTYKIGNKIQSYLEQQIILDFHFRGEQDIFEQEYPHLIEKAKKLLGFDLYLNLSATTGIPLQKNSPEYTRLMEIVEAVGTNLDQELRRHKLKLEESSGTSAAAAKKATQAGL